MVQVRLKYTLQNIDNAFTLLLFSAIFMCMFSGTLTTQVTATETDTKTEGTTASAGSITSTLSAAGPQCYLPPDTGERAPP